MQLRQLPKYKKWRKGGGVLFDFGISLFLGWLAGWGFCLCGYFNFLFFSCFFFGWLSFFKL